MGRHAQGGRNWEGFGPDPYLAGHAMNASVLGIESQGVQSCSKHFIGNEQENQRTRQVSANGTIIEALSSNIDDRTLHELYLWPFADAVRAGTTSVMCAYNRVNGRYACDDKHTLSMLKDELAFPGYVVSDWFATHGTASFANAGLDMEMPGNVSVLYGESYFGTPLLQAVENGSVPMARIDDMATRIMKSYYKLEQDVDFPSVDPANQFTLQVFTAGHAGDPSTPSATDVRGDHASLIRKLGAAGTVLLKNTNSYLPLTKPMNVGVFGNGAPYPVSGSAYFNDASDPQGLEYGLLDIGGGSGAVRHTTLTSPFESVRDYVEAYGGRVQALMDNNIIAQGTFNSIYPVPDVCLLFLKAWASEGYDRENLDLAWNATLAVENTAKLCPNTVVVIHGPGVVLMPWADNDNVTAILTAHYPGEEIGNAVVDVLWGKAEPSGRLPYTIPRLESDYGPPIVNTTGMGIYPSTNFTEGQLIDYKHFDAHNIEPLFEFGFGLSYTTFNLSQSSLEINLQPRLQATPDTSLGKIPGGWKDLWNSVATISVEVTNTGETSGSVVPQLYVGFPQDTTPSGTPVRVLRGFSKKLLEAGSTEKVPFELKRRDVSFWDVDVEEWVIPRGNFTFSVGFSSRDLRVEERGCVLQ
jgi:beta-glucosidase